MYAEMGNEVVPIPNQITMKCSKENEYAVSIPGTGGILMIENNAIQTKVKARYPYPEDSSEMKETVYEENLKSEKKKQIEEVEDDDGERIRGEYPY